MSKPVSWSHSALNAFETCPKRYYHTRVKRDIPDPPNEAATWGNRVHKALELRLKGEAGLPESLHHLEPLAVMLTRKHGKRLVEQKLAVDKNFRPCGWMDSTVWCRGVIDVALLSKTKGFLADWKTGKRKPDSDQMELMSLLSFAHYPYLEEVTTAFVWLKDGKLDSETYGRDQLMELWSNYLPRVKRLELAYEQDNWQPKPSGLCGKWCPVTKQHCPFGK